MEGNHLRISEIKDSTRDTIYRFIDTHIHKLIEAGKVAAVNIQEYASPRSLSANALYWMWLSEMATHFSKKGTTVTKDDMHDLMRHKFLGWTKPRKVGRTEIASTLRSTKKLDKSEMMHYMEKLNMWAADHKCLLTDPIESEYRQYLDKQN
jgi:hypothetical protein